MDLSLATMPASPTTTTLAPLVSASLSLIDTLPFRPAYPSKSISWSASKSSGDTKLYTTKHLNEPWIGRVTRGAKLTYEQARLGLWEKKAETENLSCGKPEDHFETGERGVIVNDGELEGEWLTEVVRKMLHIQAFSAREFLETVIFHEFPPAPTGFDGTDTTPRRSFVVISKPAEGALKDEKDVRGVYTCVERVWEREDGTVDLYFAVTSDAGGSIPRWVQNMAMPGQILSDGLAFLKWFEEGKDKEQGW